MVAFTVDFSDTTGNAGTQVTSTTDVTSVTFDKTAPTLTTVSIDSDNANSSGTDETATVGDTVTLSFTASETIGTTTAAVTVGGVSAAGSIAVTNVSGNDWNATFDLALGDIDGAVAFTIDFSDTTGNAGTQVTSTTDDTSVAAALVPGAPTELVPSLMIATVSATPGDILVVVSWTAPASEGGSPITEYTVTSDPGGVTATTTGTSVKMTGLTQNTAYTFTVTATNAAGTGLSSEPSSSVTTKLTDVWDAPATSGWGLAALVAGMLVVMVIGLGLTSGTRRAARP